MNGPPCCQNGTVDDFISDANCPFIQGMKPCRQHPSLEEATVLCEGAGEVGQDCLCHAPRLPGHR